MSSTVAFRWEKGIDLEDLLQRVDAFMKGLELVKSIYGHFNTYTLGYHTPSGLMACLLSYPQSGFKLDPSCCAWLRWQYWQPGGSDYWFSCGLGRGEKEGDPYECVRDCKVVQFRVSFDEQIWSVLTKAGDIDTTITKYHQIKDLWKFLESDVAEGYSDKVYGHMEWDPDPVLEGKVLRFAKAGRQMLLRPWEERRAPHPGETDWQIVLDPE